MSAFEQNRLHGQAAGHYYDILAKHEVGVSESIVRHVHQCLLCRAHVHRLKEILAETRGEADVPRDRMGRDIIDTLDLHFRHLGECVTCSLVKPFLPTLLIPSREIRIPTPITVHVDHCRACAADLGVIRGLDLEPGQLERLGRLYAEKARARLSLCRAARAKIPAFATASIEGIGSEFLNHLCACPECRARVYEHRQKLLDARGADDAHPGPNGCRVVTMADVFGYVVAYDLTGDQGHEPSRAKRPAGAHVRTCRFCMDKIQTLHRLAYGIADRPESGVATVYTTVEGVKGAPAPDDPYPNHPITVEVIHREAQPAATRRRRPAAFAGLNPTAFHPRMKSLLLKAAVVALAALPLALLFLNTPSASGITLSQVFKAFGSAENVHVARFYPPTGELLQEVWVSRARDVLVVREGPERTVYDLGTKEKHVYAALEATAEITELSESEYASTRRLIEGCLGFALGDVPADATWTRMDDSIAEGAEVYELTYTVQDPSGRAGLRRQEITIDPLTRLPQEIRVFNRLPAEDEWNCESRRVFEYPTESEITPAVGE
jgi:hypothetical protein